MKGKRKERKLVILPVHTFSRFKLQVSGIWKDSSEATGQVSVFYPFTLFFFFFYPTLLKLPVQVLYILLEWSKWKLHHFLQNEADFLNLSLAPVEFAWKGQFFSSASPLHMLPFTWLSELTWAKFNAQKKRKNVFSDPLAHSTALQVEAFREGGRKTGDRRRAERFLWMWCFPWLSERMDRSRGWGIRKSA